MSLRSKNRLAFPFSGELKYMYFLHHLKLFAFSCQIDLLPFVTAETPANHAQQNLRYKEHGQKSMRQNMHRVKTAQRKRERVKTARF